MKKCSDFNFIDLLEDNVSEAVKNELLEHIEKCSDCKTEFEAVNSIIGHVENLETSLPIEANDTYFANMEKEVMTQLIDVCTEVQNELVDYIDDNLDDEKKEEVTIHLEICNTCSREFQLTKALINADGSETVDSYLCQSYFEELPEKVTNKVFENLDNLCETAQDFIAYELTGDEIPKKIQRHLDTCENCKKAAVDTKQIVTAVADLTTYTPNEAYFEKLLYRIDKTIDLLPTPRLTHKEENSFFANILSVFDTLRGAILQPYSAIAVSTIIVLSIVGSRLYFNDDNVVERQINLSDLLNNSKIKANSLESEKMIPESKYEAGITASKSIDLSHPSEDEKLDLKTRGSASNSKHGDDE